MPERSSGRRPGVRKGDNPGVDTLGGIFLLAGRVLFSSLFAFSAWGHHAPASPVRGNRPGKLPIAFLAGVPTGAYLLLAAVSIVAGIWADVGALMIAAFLAPAALLFHPFWTYSDPATRRTQLGSFLRNVTLLRRSARPLCAVRRRRPPSLRGHRPGHRPTLSG